MTCTGHRILRNCKALKPTWLSYFWGFWCGKNGVKNKKKWRRKNPTYTMEPFHTFTGTCIYSWPMSTYMNCKGIGSDKN